MPGRCPRGPTTLNHGCRIGRRQYPAVRPTPRPRRQPGRPLRRLHPSRVLDPARPHLGHATSARPAPRSRSLLLAPALARTAMAGRGCRRPLCTASLSCPPALGVITRRPELVRPRQLRAGVAYKGRTRASRRRQALVFGKTRTGGSASTSRSRRRIWCAAHRVRVDQVTFHSAGWLPPGFPFRRPSGMRVRRPSNHRDWKRCAPACQPGHSSMGGLTALCRWPKVGSSNIAHDHSCPSRQSRCADAGRHR